MSISQKKWDSLPKDLQDLLVQSVKDLAVNITSQLKAADDKAVEEAKANPKITIHDWSPDERKKFRGIAQSQWEVFAKRSPNAQKVYDSVTSYLKEKGLL